MQRKSKSNPPNNHRFVLAVIGAINALEWQLKIAELNAANNPDLEKESEFLREAVKSAKELLKLSQP